MRWLISAATGAMFCLNLAAPMAHAQGTGAASVAGAVRDTSGAVLPGVTVEASSPALIEKVRTTVTDANGEYRIIELSPGTYSVTFTLPGFAVFKRDELELPARFTATLNVELKVGGLEETVTVSGQTPLVDVQNITQQMSMSKTLLDTVPTSKSIFAFTSLMPAAVSPTSQQDVGGSLGESSMRPSVHGAKPGDTKNLLDGLSYNNFSGNGSGRILTINPLSTQEVLIETASGGSAEYATAGAVLNQISRDGANRFSATIFAAGSTDALQSSNYTDELKNQGLKSVNKTLNTYDLNGVFAGPIIQDKLWFKTAHRRSGYNVEVGNLYYDANWALRGFGTPASTWKFASDFNRPVQAPEDNLDDNLRLTWQVAPNHKVNITYDYGGVRGVNNLTTFFTGTLAAEANTSGNFRVTRGHLIQATWSHPATNKLLFEAGFNALWARTGFVVTNPDQINIRDTAINFTYNGLGVYPQDHQYPTTQRFSMAYVTGGHTFKTGVLAMQSFKPTESVADRTVIPYSYTFNNGVPTQLTEFVSPLIQYSALKMALGAFAQDQWQMRKLTLNFGLRYEYLNAYAPATDRPAGPLQNAASFPQVDCLPCWHDLYPRMGAVYDLFGNGKTALKASLGRYPTAQLTTLADTFRPITSAVNSTTRVWTDTNGNFFPDCDLRATGLSGECAAMANSTFGGVQIRTTADPNWIKGYNQRQYEWTGGVSLDHELRPGVALSGGYYRTWFGNFTATDNLLVTPADYDHYCVTAPTDSRLPSNISGQQLCGFYDISTAKFGQVNNLVTLASKYGQQTEVYNGGDLTMNIRLPGGATVLGGWNIGNTISLPAGTGFGSSQLNQCFVVDTPQQLAWPVPPAGDTNTAPFNGCETSNPYQSRFKVNGSYPFPYGIQLAVVYQNLPGAPYNALTTFTRAQIFPSLGRNLSTATMSAQLLPAYSSYVDQRVNQLDMRFSKIMRFGKARLQANLDIYNIANASTTLQVNQAYGTTWLQPTQIIDARLFKIGFQVDF